MTCSDDVARGPCRWSSQRQSQLRVKETPMRSTISDRSWPSDTTIDVGDKAALRYWCGQLNVTPLELCAIVDAVGSSIDDVKAELMTMAAAPLFAANATGEEKSGA
jgi:hypothetical protein